MESKQNPVFEDWLAYWVIVDWCRRLEPPELELRCEAEMSFHVLHKKVARSAIWHYQGLFHLDLKSARPTFGKIRFITHFPSAKQNIHGSFIIIYAAKTQNWLHIVQEKQLGRYVYSLKNEVKFLVTGALVHTLNKSKTKVGQFF